MKTGIVNQKIPQFDGNITIATDSVTSEISCPCCNTLSDIRDDCDSDYDLHPDDQNHNKGGSPIPVLENWAQSVFAKVDPPAWYDEYKPGNPDPIQSRMNRKTIRRDNRVIMGESLPIIVSNLRSLAPKLKNFKIDMIEREISNRANL